MATPATTSPVVSGDNAGGVPPPPPIVAAPSTSSTTSSSATTTTIGSGSGSEKKVNGFGSVLILDHGSSNIALPSSFVASVANQPFHFGLSTPWQ
jgi:hypothetical protein